MGCRYVDYRAAHQGPSLDREVELSVCEMDPTAVREALREPSFAQAVWGKNLPHVREITRQQILGDLELLKDIYAGREDVCLRTNLLDRLAFAFSLADLAAPAGGEIPS